MMVYNTFSTIDGIISYIFLPLFDVFVAICEILSFFINMFFHLTSCIGKIVVFY